MTKNLRPEEENLSKDLRNLFRLKTEQSYPAPKNLRNLFQLEKKIKQVKIED